MKGIASMNGNTDPCPEASGEFTALSDQMRKRKQDTLAELRRIVEEHTSRTFTQEEFAQLVLNSQGDREDRTLGDRIADMRSDAEDYRCQGNASLAEELNKFAALAEEILDN